MSVSIPASGLATVDFSFSGKDLDRAETTAYFTSPTSQSNTGIVASVNGTVLFNGAPVAVITSADFTVERASENAAVAGSNSIVNIFMGRIKASGNLSLYFIDGVARNAFNQETEVTLAFSLTEGTLANSNVISFVFPRVKLNGFEKADAEQGIVASVPFMALENQVTSTGLPVGTVFIQDTAA
jgi:hypothetical protein